MVACGRIWSSRRCRPTPSGSWSTLAWPAPRESSKWRPGAGRLWGGRLSPIAVKPAPTTRDRRFQFSFSALAHEGDAFQLVKVGEAVAVGGDDVGEVAGLDRADAVLPAQHLGGEDGGPQLRLVAGRRTGAKERFYDLIWMPRRPLAA